jgi:hypothetical protein
LTALIHHYNSGFIDRGVRVCNRSPWISHLLFADDSLIFINANGASAARLNEILDIYHLASGQKVNKEKSAIFFSPCTSDTHREVVKQHLNIHIEAFSEKYLGLPTAVGKLTSEAFEYITESARSSVNGWAEKNLSYPGKEVLIKSVVQAKPIHGMSCFLLSKSTCKKFTSVMGQFWWSGNLDRRSMHWLAWDKLAMPKNQGGMGFRDMQAFNVALLGKQAWRIIMKPDSLCSQVLRTRYLHNQELMTANAPRTASKTWRAILAGREALKLGLIKRMGSGQSISIWEDCWLPNSATMRPMGRLKETDLVMVNELLTASNDWNEPLIREIFFAPDVDSILSIPLRSTGGDDWLAWSKEKSRIYTVRSAYKSLMEARQLEEARNNNGHVVSSSENDTDLWRRLWKLPVVPKVRVFWWRVHRGILPDYRTLSHRHIMDNSTCALCKAESESVMHALIECSHAKLFWEAAKEILLVKLPKLHPMTWAKDILCESFFNQHEKAIITSVMYSIGSSRNNLTHRESGFSPAKTMEMVKEPCRLLSYRERGCS